MRTTITLDDDVAAALRHDQRRSGRSWKHVVNETLRAGLAAKETGALTRADVRRQTATVRLGRPKVGDVANVHEILSLVEGEGRR